MTADTIQKAVSELKKNPTLSNADVPTEVKTLMSKLKVMGANVPGSKQSKSCMRQKIQSIIAWLGLPTLYITINPNDIDNPLVKILAGNDTDGLQFLTNSDRHKFIAKNPIAGAEFFHTTVDATIRALLGYDDSKPGKKGIFGEVQAYFGCVESQGRGSLHIHMVIWLKGAMPAESIQQKCKETSFMQRLYKYLNQTLRQDMAHLIPKISEKEKHAHTRTLETGDTKMRTLSASQFLYSETDMLSLKGSCAPYCA